MEQARSGATGVLVRVVAAGLNPIDCKIRAGQAFPFTPLTKQIGGAGAGGEAWQEMQAACHQRCVCRASSHRSSAPAAPCWVVSRPSTPTANLPDPIPALPPRLRLLHLFSASRLQRPAGAGPPPHSLVQPNGGQLAQVAAVLGVTPNASAPHQQGLPTGAGQVGGACLAVCMLIGAPSGVLLRSSTAAAAATCVPTSVPTVVRCSEAHGLL